MGKKESEDNERCKIPRMCDYTLQRGGGGRFIYRVRIGDATHLRKNSLVFRRGKQGKKGKIQIAPSLPPKEEGVSLPIMALQKKRTRKHRGIREKGLNWNDGDNQDRHFQRHSAITPSGEEENSRMSAQPRGREKGKCRLLGLRCKRKKHILKEQNRSDTV